MVFQTIKKDPQLIEGPFTVSLIYLKININQSGMEF